ncbi:3-carboxy-cis,cis-mucoante lactonizing enzyme [Viridothelium virens]|uniref:3-carboxy-cis,cis-mucoante lactonizing enzyme n=1 Tax=Viridothelium virens TaxID=1048519 RepID=A0A6A6GTS0_VIRVR|nr:3-carboxy-cis,cis-mucoante lactonizing enzyme [Viridothelium virens]
MGLLRFSSTLLASFITLGQATNLYVSSYNGSITTLELTSQNGSYQLRSVYENAGCSPNPSWLNLDQPHGYLYCQDEGLTVANGSLSSFSVAEDGELTLVDKAATITGPVNSVIYGNRTGLRSIALAHYAGSAVSSWTLSPNGTFSFLQSEFFTLAQPGPVPSRQDAPHPHETILDPTGQFILVPDLGADLVRIFGFDATTERLTELTPLKVVPGSGPRHGAFWTPDGVSGGNSTTFLYIVTELGQTVTSYAVSYPAAGGLAFEEVYTSKTYGANRTEPAGTAPAEVAISPDNRFLVISNRNDSAFSIQSPGADNSSSVELSDSLSTFQLNQDGTLTFRQLAPAGGSYPRQFSLNKVGDLVAVGLQYSGRVVIFKRDVESGLVGDSVGVVQGLGNVTCVVWDE